MGEVFVTLLNRSITVGWFILAVLCFRLVFRKNPKWVNCLLWGVVAVRLVCPFSIESPFSLLPSAEPVKSAAVVEGEVQNYIPSIDSRLTIVKNTINPMLAETFAYHESESVSPWQMVVHVAGVVWICGMIVLLICAMGSVIRLHRLVMEAVCVKENVYICDAVTSPFILGIVRPRVYLPSALNEKDMRYIIAHESAHLKRKDHWWKALGYGLLCVYWFYPLCWLAYFLFGRDIELACDERVVKRANFHEKKEYSRVLLSCARQKREVLVCPLAFGEVGVKARVKSVLHYKKPALWIVIAAVAICVMLAVCFLTNPAKEYQIPDSVETMVGSLPTEEVASLQEEVIPAKSEPIQDIVFHEQPEADKVCIEVQPSIIREQLSYYYIPTGEDQEWLSERVKALDLEGKPFAKRWEGHKERGWQIIYNDVTIRVFEGGYLYYTYDNENGEMECFIEASELCDYIQNMLINKIGYQHYDVADIKGIVSAKLEVTSIYTGWKSYSQTITDADTLKKFEGWFCNAKYVYGGADCGNESACLELTLANGDVVKLSMATDDCPNFNINGVVYDYRPALDWINREFYKCFGEIPWEYE